MHHRRTRRASFGSFKTEWARPPTRSYQKQLQANRPGDAQLRALRHDAAGVDEDQGRQAAASWRVALLPFIEQQVYFQQFKLDEAWDHPDNLKLAAQMPAIYTPRRGERGDKTHMRLFVGPGTLYDPQRNAPDRPRQIFSIIDGTSNTFYVVEATDPVLWIQPDELKYDPKGPLPPLGLSERDYFIACMCDGWVRPVKKSTPPEMIRGFITPEGGEIVQFDD